MDEIVQLSDVELRDQLSQYGSIVGPITNTTRKVYQMKLLNCRNGTIPTHGAGDTNEKHHTESPSEKYEDWQQYQNDVPQLSSHQQKNQFPNSANVFTHDFHPLPSQQSLNSSFSRDNATRSPRSQGVPLHSAPGGGVTGSNFIGSRIVNKASAVDEPPKISRESRFSDYNMSSSDSPNMTSTPHLMTSQRSVFDATPANDGTPVGGHGSLLGSAVNPQSKLFSDVPVTYPQLRQRSQPTAGGTPYTSKGPVQHDQHRITALSSNQRKTAPVTQRDQSTTPGMFSQAKFVAKVLFYMTLSVMVLIGVLTWFFMDPAVNI